MFRKKFGKNANLHTVLALKSCRCIEINAFNFNFQHLVSNSLLRSSIVANIRDLSFSTVEDCWLVCALSVTFVPCFAQQF